MKIFHDYIKDLQKIPIDQITEHTKRTTLENLLNEIANKQSHNIKIIHEPKREGKFGSPDFKVTSTESIIGYIENKKIEEDLDKVLKTDQIEKYKKLSNNIILTNYIEWIWIRDGEINNRASLCFLTDIENKKFKPSNSKIEEVNKLIENFFSQPPIGISDTKKLADVLAIRAKYLKEFLLEELLVIEKQKETNKLSGLYETFRDHVFENLTISEFSDAFSQTLVYGLFLAKLNVVSAQITLLNAKKYIPQSFELIKELVNFLDELENEEYRPIRWLVEEILTIMNNLDIKKIYENLSFNNRKRDKDNIEIKDPYVYFYEDFLASYDYALRKAKGVYYTPPPVVDFIVRGINDLTKNIFSLKNGLAEKNHVTVLDFATGTGTFLLAIIQQIIMSLPEGSGKRDSIIQEHVLKNLYGFEYLIAPYTIAHLKLSQFLKDIGYEMHSKEHFQIFLTNTLVPFEKQFKIPLLPALSKEIESAQAVKDLPILVITGNPPYSKKSKNTGMWITNLLKGIDIYAKKKTNATQETSYYMVDGKPLKEKQNWLRDDYVKFIRFAQWKMQHVENGIIGIITSHRFLDNVTFRGMRQSLLNTFNQLYFLDLHGSIRQEENVPDGIKDENVFDIEQGVAISFFIKKNGLEKKVFHSDMWGSRIEKYKRCLDSSIENIEWQEINPISPYYFFVPRSENYNYQSFWSVTNIFKAFNLPLMTGNDQITYHFTQSDLEKTLEIFTNKTVNEIKTLYNITEESSNWTVLKAKNDVVRTKSDRNLIRRVAYRLFDERITYFTGNSSGFHSRPGTVSNHMLYDNIGLLLPRQISKKTFQHVFCVDTIPDMCCFSSETKGANQLFPLFLYYEDIVDGKRVITKETNFSSDFNNFISKKYKSELTPEQILGYIYAILHSQTYRDKYFNDLQVTFAKIPFISSIEDFKNLSLLGTELIDAHLLKSTIKSTLGAFIGKGSNSVDKVDYDESSLKISINNTQYFENVSSEIFEFKIGGYQPIDKYLKLRKGRILSFDEIESAESIIKVISFTINKMNEIDELTKDWI